MILMDLDMPVSDGFDGCQKIRNLYKNSNKIVAFESKKYLDKGERIEAKIKLGEL